MTRIAAVHPALPPHRYSQHEITDAFARMCPGPEGRRALLDRLHTSAKVATRHLALPLSEYGRLRDFGTANDTFIETAVEIGSQVVLGALERSGLAPEDVDVIFSTTVTGIAVPSLEARIATRIGLRPDVKRVPLIGLGCLGGAAGVARLHDYLVGWPQDVGVLLSVELCSLTVQVDDPSTANMVASGLFGDGAVALVAVGDHREAPDGVSWTGPEVLASRAHLYPDSQRAMGWDIGASGLKIVLGAEVPDLVEQYLGTDVRDFLADHDLKTEDVAAWVAHPGGPKVLEAMQQALGVDREVFRLTWESLEAIGNLSSASVLTVLHDTLEQRRPPAGSPGLMLAMGPGFCSEMVLLRW
jgi:alkylresorcinol/alkylpyrone synthase